MTSVVYPTRARRSTGKLEKRGSGMRWSIASEREFRGVNCGTYPSSLSPASLCWSSPGYALDDKIPLDLYGKHRDGEEGWRWDEDAPVVTFELDVVQAGSDPTKVALVLNLSGTIQRGELPDHLGPDYHIFEIHPVGVTPNRSILSARASLKNFADAYHMFLSELERLHKSARELHLFAAIPVAAAVLVGRGLMRDVHPAVIVYDRVAGGGFEVTVEVNRR